MRTPLQPPSGGRSVHTPLRKYKAPKLVGPELIYGFNTKQLTSSLDSAGFAVDCWK